MSEESDRDEDDDDDVIHDGLGISYFLQSRRCKSCDD
jgi:hypothetical protein